MAVQQTRKKLKFGAGSLTFVILVIAAIVIVNLLGLAFFARWDLTDGKIYSLSDFSEKVMNDLDDVILVKLYFTDDLPAPYNANARYIKDQLYEYKEYGHGKMKVEIIDPVKDHKEDEARGLGIPAVQVNAIEKDKIELKRVYMGMAILFEDKREVLPLIQSTNNLEYEITSAIKRLTSEQMSTVGFLTGHGEPDPQTDLRLVSQMLEKQYVVTPVSITPGQLIDENIQTLIVVGPTQDLTEFEKYAIDQFIMRGGKVGWFVDGVIADISGQGAQNRVTNLDEFLLAYGIKINKDLVIDTRNSRIGVMQRQGQISYQSVVEYPFIPEAVTFSEDNLITKDIGAVNLPFVSTLDTTLAEGLNLLFKPIVYSSERSGRKHEPYDIQPMQKFTIDDFPEAYLPLAATVVGTFQSYYTAHPVPDSGLGKLPDFIGRSPVNRMVVFGDSDFMRDQGARNPENAALFLNTIDWLSQDEGLISIRSRTNTSRPLDPNISDSARWWIKYTNIFGPALLVVLFGVIRWRIRLARRRSVAARQNRQAGGR